MEEKCCYRCEAKQIKEELNYQMENCNHIYCSNCIFQNIFVHSLSSINNIDNIDNFNFTVHCLCPIGSIQIPMDKVEELFSKKYTIDSQEIKEKNICSKHKNEEKTYFCKYCEKYICPKCTNLNDKEDAEYENRNNNTENDEHVTHKVFKAEKLCNKYKDFLKDIQIENKSINEFIEKFNKEISKYEAELEKEINATLKQIDDIINKLYLMRDEYTKILEKKYSNCNRLLKIIKLFYANYYLDYENKMNINDIYTLEYLKDVNYEFEYLEFKEDIIERSLEKTLIDIKSNLDNVNLKKDKYNDFIFHFKEISRKYNIIQKLIGHRQKIKSVIELDDGRLLTGGADYKMKFWEEQDGKFVDSLTISEQVDSILCLCQLKDLRIISTSEGKGTIKIWNKVKNSETYKVTSLSGHESSITSLIQLPDGRLLTGSKDKTIIVWELSENLFKRSQILSEHTDAINCLCLLTGNRFASGSDDKTIRIWEEEKGSFRCVNILKEHKTRVTALILTTTDCLIAGGDKTITVYKLKESKFIKLSNIEAHSDNITKIIKLSDNKIASAGRDNLIKIWIEKNGELTQSEILKGHTHSVYDIVELKDGRLASVGGDNLVIIWKSGKFIE